MKTDHEATFVRLEILTGMDDCERTQGRKVGHIVVGRGVAREVGAPVEIAGVPVTACSAIDERVIQYLERPEACATCKHGPSKGLAN